MKKSFILHIDSLNVLDELSDNQAAELFRAIKNYHTQKEIQLTGLMKAVFIPFENQFKRDENKYQNICERNKENGKKGGRPTKQEVTENPKKPKKPSGLFGNPKEPKKPDSDNDSNNDNDNKNDKEILNTPPDYFFNLYNKICTNLPKVKKLTTARKIKIKARLKEYNIEEIKTALTKVNESKFCGGDNDRQWKADFDFVFSESGMTKIIEDKYKNPKPKLQDYANPDLYNENPF